MLSKDFIEFIALLNKNKVDLLTSLEGLCFEDCYPQKKTLTIDGISVDFIDLHHLRINKQSTGRSQDIADLENLR